MTKVCPSCKIEKPLTEFYKNKNRKNDVGTYCKECTKNKYTKIKKVDLPPYLPPKRKVCPGCKVEKDIDEFYVNRTKKDGHTSRCKSCIAEYHKIYYQENKEKVYERSKDWINRNREYVRERGNKYYRDNIDKMHLKDKKYRDSHKDKLYEKGKKYRASHKDYFYNKARERKNIKNMNSDGTVTLEAEMEILKSQNYLCDYCGEDISERKHLDHITPLDKGGLHTISNVHFTCPSCNLSKGTKTEEEWFEWLSINRKDKYNKIINFRKIKE